MLGKSATIPSLQKPKALKQGARLRVIAPASPARPEATATGLKELQRLGFQVQQQPKCSPEGYFSASTAERRRELVEAFTQNDVDGVVGLRGGYGSNYLLGPGLEEKFSHPKVFIGYSDLTSLQIFLWQRHGWVTFYGPMVASGFDADVGAPHGYDEQSFRNAVSKTDGGWDLALQGESLATGEAEGRLLGGCMTLLEATIGTPWELDTNGAILVLEDRAMKPYQVDRVLMHLLQSKKLSNLRGIVLGEFPECDPPVAGSPTVRDVCARILAPLGVPIIFGAPIGHTPRPMLTFPLGVHAQLRAKGEGMLEVLEPAVVP